MNHRDAETRRGEAPKTGNELRGPFLLDSLLFLRPLLCASASLWFISCNFKLQVHLFCTSVLSRGTLNQAGSGQQRKVAWRVRFQSSGNW